MSIPVRKWTNIELSPMGRAPRRKPKRAKAVTKSGSRPGDRSRRSGACRTPPVLLEVLGDVDDGGPDDHDEESREDAEHHREQHLHGSLEGLLLGQLTALDAHLVGLGPEHAADGDA